MYQLLLDSSNKYLAVGLSKEGKVIDKIFYEAWQRQSEVMTNEVDTILSRNNVDKKDLDAICVGIGPGSYTGVRIAITIAKTIAYCLKIDIYAVNSLALLADENKPTICIYNARSGRSYFAVFNGTEMLEKCEVKTNDEVLAYISDHKDYAINGELEHLGLTSGKYDYLENLAKSLINENKVSNVFGLNPLYLKDL